MPTVFPIFSHPFCVILGLSKRIEINPNFYSIVQINFDVLRNEFFLLFSETFTKFIKITPLTQRKMNSTAFDIIIKSINE